MPHRDKTKMTFAERVPGEDQANSPKWAFAKACQRPEGSQFASPRPDKATAPSAAMLLGQAAQGWVNSNGTAGGTVQVQAELEDILKAQIEFVKDELTTLNKNDYRILNKVADVLKKYPSAPMVVEGHTSYRPCKDYPNACPDEHWKLSEDRAVVVVQALQDLGVQNPLQAAGLGCSCQRGMVVVIEPVASDAGDTSYAKASPMQSPLSGRFDFSPGAGKKIPASPAGYPSKDLELRTPRGQEDESNGVAARWWLSEAKRIRAEAQKLRQERDAFRTVLEDERGQFQGAFQALHGEQKRLLSQNQAMGSNLNRSQLALQKSKAMAAGARRELDQLHARIAETSENTMRLSAEGEEYAWQQQEMQLTIDAAESTAQDLKLSNETLQWQVAELREQMASYVKR